MSGNYKTTYTQNSERNVKLSNLKLGYDKLGYYLTAIYNVETPNEYREVYIPKIRLPITTHDAIIGWDDEDWVFYGDCHTAPYADIGFGKMRLDYDESDDGYYYIDKLIETKTKEMTLEEIEKKLGHKVKIVNK